MFGHKKKYDLICSLGGNCAAAHNLLYKGLRTKAYPFDWTYFKSDEAVYALAEGFKNNFKYYALMKNFIELPVNPEHPDKIQYEDTFAKIIWANHFKYNVDRNNDYNEVKEKLDRRFLRLINSVKKSKKILFIFSTSFEIMPDAFLYLINTLNTIYSDKVFKIIVLSFSANKNYIYINNNVEIHYYDRQMNNNDFCTTNTEWEFLNEINNPAKMRNYLTKIFIKLVPIKRLRHKLREKYHVK